jgi:hypothetical protein
MIALIYIYVECQQSPVANLKIYYVITKQT